MRIANGHWLRQVFIRGLRISNAIMFVRNIIPAIFAVVVFVASAAPLMAEDRTWTDKSGKFTVEAELVEVKNKEVVLKKSNGKKIAVPLDRLSAADRRYLQSLAKSDSRPSDGRARVYPSFPDAVTKPPPWNDANPPYDLAAFLLAPPAEDNAAPLYLEAFIEFSRSEMAALFPKMPEHEMSQWFLADRQLSQQEERLEDAWKKGPQSIDNAAVDAWLANYDAGFEKLAAAQRRPKCMFQTGRSLHSVFPHIQVARQVARVVEWRTRRDIQRGELERPLEDLKMQLRLNRDLQVRGAFITQVASIAIDDQCCKLVRAILNAPGIDTRRCDQLLALLAEHQAKAIDRLV